MPVLYVVLSPRGMAAPTCVVDQEPEAFHEVCMSFNDEKIRLTWKPSDLDDFATAKGGRVRFLETKLRSCLKSKARSIRDLSEEEQSTFCHVVLGILKRSRYAELFLPVRICFVFAFDGQIYQ